MPVKVGELFYEVSIDLQKLIAGNRQVDKELKQTSGSIEKLGTSLTAVVGAIKIYAAAAALVKSANLADEMRMLAVRVQVAAGGIEQGANALRSLQAISTKTQTALAANVDVFARLNQSILQMGGTQRDTLALTETLAQAIKVSGASAEEAKNAMLQFGQALGSGKLQGDELRSLMENAPYLMRQLADALGVPVGALKKLGEEGKLTSDVVTNALSKAASKIEADFKQFPQTLGGAFTVAADAAMRANERLDELTGTSTALTGIAKGVGEAFEFLATLFGQSTNEADKLGRNKAIQTWADGTVRVLSYVLDAADFVTRVFRELGTLIGGVAASAANAAQGKFAAAAQTMKDTFKDVMAFSDPTYAGVRLRQQQDALKMTPEADRMDRAASGSGGPRSKLKAPAGGGGKKESKFDGDAYLAGLAEKAASEWDRVTLIEQEALRKNGELLKQGKITAEEAAKARTFIEERAAQERTEIGIREAGERYEYLTKAWEKEKELVLRQEEERKRGREMASDIINGGDPISKLQAELQEKSQALLEAYERDKGNEELYAAAKVALEEQTAAKIKEIRDRQSEDQLQQQSQQLQAFGNLFGGMADLTKTFAGKQSGVYKAMFAVSKAFAIADSIVKIQQGIAGAAALPFPANIPAMASVVAATSGIVSTISSVQYGGGRQYGGPVAAGSLYRVNETGRPEMFTANNGNQYMLGTSSGQVTPADEVGQGGVPWKLIVMNAPAGYVPTISTDERAVIVDMAAKVAEASMTQQVASNSGPFYNTLKGATNVQGRLS